MTADAWMMGSGAPTVMNTAAMPSVASDASPKARATASSSSSLGELGGSFKLRLAAREGLEGVVRVAVLLPLLAEGLKPGVPRPPPCRLKFLGLFHAALLSFSSPGWYNRGGLLPGEGVNTNEGFPV